MNLCALDVILQSWVWRPHCIALGARSGLQCSCINSFRRAHEQQSLGHV